MLSVFSNREIAIGIWTALLLTCGMGAKMVRSSVRRVLRLLFSKTLLLTFFVMGLYQVAEIYLLKKLGVWDWALMKETALWALFTSLPLFFNTVGAVDRQEINFRGILINALGALAVFEYVVNFFTFGLTAELLIIPVVFFCAVGAYIANSRPDLTAGAKLLGALLGLIGLVVVSNSILHAIEDHSIISLASFRGFVIGPLLTALFLPCLYAFSLYAVYSGMFWRISSALKSNPALACHAKQRALKIGRINLSGTCRLSKVVARRIWSASSIGEVDYIFDSFCVPTNLVAGDRVTLMSTGEVGTVIKRDVDFAIVGFSDGECELWVGELISAKNDSHPKV